MTVRDIYKYGIGLLDLSVEELEDMDFGDFILQVDAKLLMQDEQIEDLADNLLPYHAIFTSVLMGSSGNMKKSYDSREMARSLYPKERVWGPKNKTGKSNKDYKSSKEELIKKFELDLDEIDL